MKKSLFPFRDLVRTDTRALPVIVAVSGILGAVALPRSRIMDGIIALPAVPVLVYLISIGVFNTWRRSRWAARFGGRLSGRQAINGVRTAPDRATSWMSVTTADSAP